MSCADPSVVTCFSSSLSMESYCHFVKGVLGHFKNCAIFYASIYILISGAGERDQRRSEYSKSSLKSLRRSKTNSSELQDPIPKCEIKMRVPGVKNCGNCSTCDYVHQNLMQQPQAKKIRNHLKGNQRPRLKIQKQR